MAYDLNNKQIGDVNIEERFIRKLRFFRNERTIAGIMKETNQPLRENSQAGEQV